MTSIRGTLGKQAWWLLFISGVFSLSVGLSNTFVNIYLWKVDHNYGSIGWYNFANYCLIPVMFVVSGYLAKRLHTVWTLRIGIFLHGAFYAISLIGGTAMARLPVILGIVMGTAAGFYWFSFNILSMDVTEHGARDKFFGLNGVMGAMAGMIAPPVSGWLISYEDRLGGLSGYHIIFGLSMGLFAVATLMSAKMKGEKTEDSLQLGAAWRALRVRPWSMALFGCMVYGIREGVFTFLIGVLLYVATRSEFGLGKFVLLQSALSFASFYLVGKFLKPANRMLTLGIGAVCMAGAALLFLLPVTARLIVVYGSIIAIVIPVFITPLQGFIFDGISALKKLGKDDTGHVPEHIIAREVFQNIGRICGIGAFIILVAGTPTAKQVSYFALAIGFVQLGTWLLLKVGRTAAFAMAPQKQKTNGEVHRLSDTRDRFSLDRRDKPRGGAR